MRRTKLFFAALVIGAFFGSMQAEEIVLQDLYGAVPLDDSPVTWGKDRPDDPELDSPTARTEGNAVIVDFKNPAGNTQVFVSRGDGSIFRQHSELNPQSVRMDMSGATAGRYLLEVYTDEEALGGVFEVK